MYVQPFCMAGLALTRKQRSVTGKGGESRENFVAQHRAHTMLPALPRLPNFLELHLSGASERGGDTPRGTYEGKEALAIQGAQRAAKGRFLDLEGEPEVVRRERSHRAERDEQIQLRELEPVGPELLIENARNDSREPTNAHSHAAVCDLSDRTPSHRVVYTTKSHTRKGARSEICSV